MVRRGRGSPEALSAGTSVWWELPKAVHQEGPGPGLLLETPGWWGPGGRGLLGRPGTQGAPVVCVWLSLTHTHTLHTHPPPLTKAQGGPGRLGHLPGSQSLEAGGGSPRSWPRSPSACGQALLT